MRAFLVYGVKSRVFRTSSIGVIALGALLSCGVARGQDAAGIAATGPRPLITQAVDESLVSVLKGNTHPLARAEFDLGTAPAALPMQRMLLVLKRSDAQEAALEQLLDDLQNKNSPSYHQWLTPEQFGQQFGPTDADMQTITNWLQSHGFEVGSTKGRTVLEFSGSASQVQEAFHTTIHKYVVNGEQHWANASDPSIPMALSPAVAGVASLNNFEKKAMNRFVGTYSEETKALVGAAPSYTFGCGNGSECYGIVPYDFATIYDVAPLWTAGINGTGQTIAIVGRTNINPNDATTFWQLFGLTVPANKLQVTLNGPDPGITGDEAEADIDIQWSGAVAPQATINFVTSASTETTDGIDLSAVYIVENNVAAVVSESYGECELGLGTAGNQFEAALWGQAAAQGMTVMVSSGDNGAAGCDNPSSAAQFGLSVNGNASTPYNVAVGGTDFNEYNKWTTYWNSTNDATTQASAKGYIPETTWNDSCTNSLAVTLGFGSTAEQACNNYRMIQAGGVNSTGGSGGASNCTTNTQTVGSCSQGYAKPSWQTGTGVPNDGKRDLPDVSLFASNGFLGTFYLVCQSDATYGVCDLNNLAGFGGTSVSSPAFAGIMALVNQKTGERQGNANYILYKLAAQQPSAFHDVPAGSTIAMPCLTGSPNCTTKTAGDSYGVLSGYSTTTGYDQATGLGSVDANNLVTKWSLVTLAPSVTTLSSLTPTTLTHGQAVNFTASVKPQTGTGTPSGQISLMGGTSGTQSVAAFALSSGAASGSTEMLPGGSYSVTAHYPGDATYAASDSGPISVTVNAENSLPQAFLVTFDSSGNLVNSNTSTAMYGSPYLLRVNVENAAGQMCNPVSKSGATACPSGNVTLTDNGSSLDAGTYTLNSYGYVEDLTVQLMGGSHSIVAAYQGDSSFNANSVTSPITITRAPTTMSQTYIYGATVGQPATITVYVNTTTPAAAPSGTVTFYANGTALKGTVSYSPYNGGLGSYAYLYAALTTDTTAFPTPGSYAITATYNADANYSTSTSSATNISVLYPTPNVVVTPTQQTVNYGGTGTISALVDTSNKSTYPTGTVTFVDAYSGVKVAGPTTCTSTTDTSGNFACQAVATFTVTSSDPISSNYSGDASYPASSAWAFISMPDFGIFPQGVVQVTAGQSQSVTIILQSQNGLSGTVSNFACSGLPAETTCTFSPTQVTLPNNGNVSTTLTVSTTAIGQARRHVGFNARNWGSSGVMLLLGMYFLGIPLSRRRGRIPVALMLALLFLVLPSCGGGSGGGGGGGTPNPVPSITSLSPTQVAAGSQIQSLSINGSNFMTSSTVTYNGTLHNSSLQSPTQIQVALGPGDVGTTGAYPVVVTNPSPGGGASAPVNFSVVTGTPTGNFNITLTATSGPITHTTTIGMYVQ
ncbi:MAG TPA: Ig-like domain repeat protein [Candidatus Sulfotelmatobacter sp.]|nr:Ig-like domain repeat protein [Candidatus Sulfotelmatobacter sp.]